MILFADHILATAAGNGAVVLWNLNKITKQKQGKKYINVVPAANFFVGGGGGGGEESSANCVVYPFSILM